MHKTNKMSDFIVFANFCSLALEHCSKWQSLLCTVFYGILIALHCNCCFPIFVCTKLCILVFQIGENIKHLQSFTNCQPHNVIHKVSCNCQQSEIKRMDVLWNLFNILIYKLFQITQRLEQLQHKTLVLSTEILLLRYEKSSWKQFYEMHVEK